MNIRLFLLLSLVLTLTTSLYQEDSPVFKLTQRNFKDTVLMSDEFWLVQFYAPWCGHCKKAVPQYKQTAQILKGIVNVGAADMTTDPGTGSPYGVSGYPTIKLFGPNKDKPIDYSSGNRTFEAFVEFCLKQMKQQIQKRKKTVQSQTQQL